MEKLILGSSSSSSSEEVLLSQQHQASQYITEHHPLVSFNRETFPQLQSVKACEVVLNRDQSTPNEEDENEILPAQSYQGDSMVGLPFFKNI